MEIPNSREKERIGATRHHRGRALPGSRREMEVIG
jgi:hypothetical protein